MSDGIDVNDSGRKFEMAAKVEWVGRRTDHHNQWAVPSNFNESRFVIM